MRIVGLSGSLRRASLNSALLRAASELSPDGVDFDVRTIEGIPVYDGDVEERDGLPASVVQLKDALAEADGIFIATPEYNSSIPGPLKNAIDWCSRPVADIERVFSGKPVALCGASAGRLGTALAQAAWLPVVRQLGLRIWPDAQLLVPAAHKVFDPAGYLVDEAMRRRLEEFVGAFVAHCKSEA